MGADAQLRDTEGTVAHALGDAILVGPHDRDGVVGVGIHIGEADAACVELRLVQEVVQEGDGLGAVDDQSGAEGAVADTAGDALGVGPQDGVVEEVGLLHILGEGVLNLHNGLARGAPQHGDVPAVMPAFRAQTAGS